MAPVLAASVPARERLIFALDVADTRRAKELVARIGSQVVFYKLGLELAMDPGYFPLLDWLKERGHKIFVDLKFFDVPATVARAVARLQGRGIDFCTIHGNDGMLKAAVEVTKDVKLLAVTALTSLDQGDLEDLGFQCTVQDLVVSRAQRAAKLGCDGVIASGQEARLLRQAVLDQLLIVTPGIRPVLNEQLTIRQDDQKRVVSVATAFADGADYIVVGRPIRDAADPAAAAAQIQQQIAEIFLDKLPAQGRER